MAFLIFPAASAARVSSPDFPDRLFLFFLLFLYIYLDI